MITGEHTRSLAELRDNPRETIDRLKHTGDAEILTVDGEAKAVLMSPETFDHLTRELFQGRDLLAIRKSMQQIEEGKTKLVHEAFAEIRAKLLAMKAASGVSSK